MIISQDSAPLPPSSFTITNTTASSPWKKRKLIALTFKVFEKEEEFSAIIKGNLSMDSSMKDVIDEYSITDYLSISDLSKCKFLIKKTSGSYYTLVFPYFHSLTVDELISLELVSNDYMIEIKTEER